MNRIKRGLFWFRNDLRLEDNPALNSLCSACDELVFVYIFDPALLEKNQFDQIRMGSARWQFIKESLDDLQQQLNSHNQSLIFKVGNPTDVLTDLINSYHISDIGVTPFSAVYEKQEVQEIGAIFKDRLSWHCEESFTLLNQKQLPCTIDDLPDGFTPFRKIIEKNIQLQQISEKCVAKLSHFPTPIATMKSDSFPDIPSFTHPIDQMKHKGGEQAALKQLSYYCHQSKHLSQYKETRNGLDGWDFSSKLSAYLAQGCISPRQVIKTILDYEQQYGENQSTYWLYFELLWREFYQWHQEKYQSQLYLESGIQNKDPELSYNQMSYDAWVAGKTNNDFVNAFMRQLTLTGWMSNRGRQIVASYFVNQLQLDWRYGAAWFELQLIDYDPANNWGNWQYLAGVGVDPRGRRAFNIEKQRQTYDPKGLFIKQYLGVTL